MKVGYIRVSTEEQNTARQEILMQELGIEKLFVDKCSGKNTQRPELKEMFNFIREGDTVIVESYSRLARSTSDLLKLVDRFKNKGVEFISKKENIDTSTPQGKLMLTMFAAIYEFERESIAQRCDEGISIAKTQSKYKGRKPIEFDEELFAELYIQWKNGETQPKYMIQKLGLTRNTFYRKLALYEQKHGIIKAEKKIIYNI